MKEIVVVGGGFAGFSAATNAVDEIVEAGAAVRVTLVSRDPYLVIRPRLYEKDPETLRAPLRPALDPLDVPLVEGSATSIDTAARTVTVEAEDGKTSALRYNRLILATGSELRVLPIPGVAEHSFNIDTWDSAVGFDRHLRTVLTSPGAPGRDTFVIVGGGMSGIELAAEMRRRIAAHGDLAAAARARIVLIEQADLLGPEFGDDPRPVLEEAMRQAEVEIRLGARVAAVDAVGVTLADGQRIEAATTVIATGLKANPLGALIPARRDELDRVHVDDYLRVEGVPEVFAAGDIARAWADDDHLALMSCQHARTMGKYAGVNAARDLIGGAPLRYRQTDYTTCLDLGDFGAVFSTGWDRKVAKVGAEAKERKTMINTQWIYPPASDDPKAILAAMRIDERGR